MEINSSLKEASDKDFARIDTDTDFFACKNAKKHANSKEKNYEIKSYDVTMKDEIKPYSLLHYFEDIAYLNATELGFGYKDIIKRNMTWFVIRYHIKFEKMPRAWKTLKMMTFPTGVKGVQCLRDFEFFVGEEKMGVASSSWTLIDLNAKRPLNPKKNLVFPEFDGKRFLETDFGGFKEFENPDLTHIFEIRFDDIDINKHVNNASYISWALNTLPHDFRLERTISEIEIAYKQETDYNTNINSFVRFVNNETHHRLTNGDVTLCDIKILWK